MQHPEDTVRAREPFNPCGPIGTLVVTTDASTAVAQHGAPADGEWRTYGGDPPELIALGLPD